jgi:hypothetical protein
MKSNLFNYLSVLLLAVFAATGCKKEGTEKLTADAEVATHYDDESLVSEETDAIADELNSLIEADPVLGGDASVLDEVICDATVSANFESDPMTVTVTFNGATCNSKRTRSGVVVISMANGQHWKNAGAQITVSYQDLKITRKSDGKSITLNGYHKFTNQSGGLLHKLATTPSIIHTIFSDNLSIKFDDGDARQWNVSRKRVYTYQEGIVLTVHGMHEDGSEQNIADWGVNRFGNSFITQINTPVVVKQSCNFRITGGEISHKTDEFQATATFGLDVSGNPTGCPGDSKYYYRLGWKRQSNGNSFSLLLPY